eukprot:TRINITY_DN1486_c0_g2_i4.p1 TRINITY_DN1486_c0_g2~~TRINITY_DN1486_c0_g2_i4.p1  ORF type:complete len:769 (+),score=310.38 TRINITY_DN1486_c0_g2_i4:62-2308(+)
MTSSMPRPALFVAVAVFAAALLALIPEAEAACAALEAPSSGGDGYIPILGPDNRIYNVYHHQDAAVQCTNPFAGTRCTGYPSTAIKLNQFFVNVDWASLTGAPGVTFSASLVQNNNEGPQFRCSDASRPECLELVLPVSFKLSDGFFRFGVACFDTKTRTLCAGRPVTILNPTAVYANAVHGGIVGLERVDDKAYSIDIGMNVLCYDLKTSQRCTGYPQQIPSSVIKGANPAVNVNQSPAAIRFLNYKGRPSLYVVANYFALGISPFNAQVTCIDLTSPTLAICSEYKDQSYSLSNGAVKFVFGLFFEYDTAGSPISICLFSRENTPTSAKCLNLADPTISTGTAMLAALKADTGNLGIIHQVTVNNRMYFGVHPTHGVHCYDFTTAAVCPNFPAKKGATATQDYGVAVDPNGSCMFSLGHTSVLYSFDAEGNVPCASTRTPTAINDAFIAPDVSTEIILDVLANDADFDPESLKIIVNPASTKVKVDLTIGKIRVTPSQDSDSFTYQICLPGFDTGSATAVVTVNLKDSDLDGVPDYRDNCPKIANFDQSDVDKDGQGDICGCDPDTKPPVLKCFPTFTVSLNAAPFAFEVAPSSLLTSVIDNCGLVPKLVLDKSVFTLQDSLAPVTVKVTGTDPSGNSASCSSSVTTKMVGSIVTNPSFSLLSIRRGSAFVLTWNTNVQPFSSTDKVTIKLFSSANVFISTAVNGARFTAGSASVTFSTTLSAGVSYRLESFINNIPAGSNVVRFV